MGTTGRQVSPEFPHAPKPAPGLGRAAPAPLRGRARQPHRKGGDGGRLGRGRPAAERASYPALFALGERRSRDADHRQHHGRPLALLPRRQRRGRRVDTARAVCRLGGGGDHGRLCALGPAQPPRAADRRKVRPRAGGAVSSAAEKEPAARRYTAAHDGRRNRRHGHRFRAGGRPLPASGFFWRADPRGAWLPHQPVSGSRHQPAHRSMGRNRRRPAPVPARRR